MRDYAREMAGRTAFIKDVLASSGAKGLVFANSGGKDCVLAGALCKAACEDTVGLIMPCGTKANYGRDMEDGLKAAARFGIETRVVDLTAAKDEVVKALGGADRLKGLASANIAPRLRMTAMYAVANGEGRLVCGTGNRSERYMGYFTMWGDGAYDFNPIGDLTVTEVYEFLRFLNAPASVIDKPPSAGLYEGQTDEGEMGVTYASIDALLLNGATDEASQRIIAGRHASSGHKRRMPLIYGNLAENQLYHYRKD